MSDLDDELAELTEHRPGRTCGVKWTYRLLDPADAAKIDAAMAAGAAPAKVANLLARRYGATLQESVVARHARRMAGKSGGCTCEPR